MTRAIRIVLPVVAMAFLATAQAGARADETVERFFGSFVGTGNAENLLKGEKEVRDLDVSITEFKDDGFTLKWITVVRGEDGARTGDDVRRREVEESFIPVEDKENVFVLAPTGGLFQKAELPNPLLGEAIRWAAIEGNAMTVYSLAINDSGGAELQVYRRALTEKGMDITFQRLKDEQLVVRMKGTLVRTE